MSAAIESLPVPDFALGEVLYFTQGVLPAVRKRHSRFLFFLFLLLATLRLGLDKGLTVPGVQFPEVSSRSAVSLSCSAFQYLFTCINSPVILMSKLEKNAFLHVHGHSLSYLDPVAHDPNESCC